MPCKEEGGKGENQGGLGWVRDKGTVVEMPEGGLGARGEGDEANGRRGGEGGQGDEHEGRRWEGEAV